MPTQLQFRRGNTSQHSTFTGAVGEITIDTEKKTVVVHDGVTPGGQPLAIEGAGGGGGFTNGQSISVANLVVTGSFTANGSIGTAGQVLASNGTSLYWKTDSNDGAAAYSNAVSYTDAAIANLVSTAPSTLNTLGELAAALGNNANFSTTVLNGISSAYTNAVSVAATDASSKAATAYSNAVSYADTKAATAYSNAISVAATDASSKAATAYSNAVSYADTKAGQAYSNAISVAATDASTKAATAYSNAVSVAATDASTKADQAYSNAVAYAASNTYVNDTFAPKASPSFTGTVTLPVVSANGSTGTAGQVLTTTGNGVYWSTPAAGGGSLTIAQANSTANTESYTSITTLQFDEDSGFDVTNPEPGVARIAMNSTFKFWEVDGVQQLTANGLDTVNFVSGDNITITANGSATPQELTISQKAITKSSFTGNGSNTEFTLSSNTVGADDILVYVDGFYYHPEDDYNVPTAGTLTFVSAPADGAEIRVRYIRIPNQFIAGGGSSSAGDLMSLSGTEDLQTGSGTEDLMV